jgi:predicted MFS family arabinose efflux permease
MGAVTIADAPAAGIRGRVVALLAVACGGAVANIYYAQPLLDAIASDLRVSAGAAGLLVTASQVGYAAGLLALVPLGDLLERRSLVARMLCVTAAALALTAAAPSFPVLAAGIAVVGVTSVVAQILVPFASTLAGEHERGQVVGRVMSGLLIGILLARTVSGLVAQAGGWRLVYVLAAVGMLVLAAVLARALPASAPPAEMRYPELLRSVGTLIREQPVLRRRMAYGALGMAGFSVLWTAIAPLLARPPYGYGEAVIGLFGLAGLAGAGAASAAGRLADAGWTRRATGGFLLAVAASWALLALGADALVPLVVGIVVLDLGIQGAHILNQSVIYSLVPEARSRLTTAYMTGNFAGGALGSGAAALAWDAGGWGAVSALGAAFGVTALAVWLTEGR